MEIKKSLGIDQNSGLEQSVLIRQFVFDVFSKRATLVYTVQTFSPTGILVSESNPQCVDYYNSPPVVENRFVKVADAVMENGKIITPDKHDFKDVEIVPAVTKYDDLAASEIGQKIIAFMQNEIDKIQIPDNI